IRKPITRFYYKSTPTLGGYSAPLYQGLSPRFGVRNLSYLFKKKVNLCILIQKGSKFMRELLRKNWLKIVVVFVLVLLVLIFVGLPYFNSAAGPDNDNEEVNADDTRIAAIGDSITYDLYVAASEDDFYPQQLDDLLGMAMWFIISACQTMLHNLLVIFLMKQQRSIKKV
ncbi:hypothetical protein LQF61_03335, partial [Tetragenococcus koreensis]